MLTPLVDDALLVLLHPRTGRGPIDVEATSNVLVGALLLDLVTRGRLRPRAVDPASGADLLEVVDRRQTGDVELDAALAELCEGTWTTAQMLGVRRRGLRRRAGQRLLESGRVARGRGWWRWGLVPEGGPEDEALRVAVAEAARGPGASTRAAQLVFLASTQGLADRAARVPRREVDPATARTGGPEWLRAALTSRPGEGGHVGAV